MPFRHVPLLALALAVPHDDALRIRDDVAFFQPVQAVLAKRAPGNARPEEELDHAVRQIIPRAVAPEGMVDIFAATGLSSCAGAQPAPDQPVAGPAMRAVPAPTIGRLIGKVQRHFLNRRI